VNLEIKYDYQNGPMDLRGILEYSNGKSDAILEEALKNSPSFAAKYKDMDNINKQFYQSRYKDIQGIANTLRAKLEKINIPEDPKKDPYFTYFWKNSKGDYFAPQFNYPKDSKTSS
jgi:hypothetical protein